MSAKAHNVCLPEHYDRLVTARMGERGISRSEALRQFIDEAANKNGSYKSKVIKEQIRIIREECRAIAGYAGGRIQAAIATIEELT